MGRINIRHILWAAVICCLSFSMRYPARAFAQDASSPLIRLYVDPRTKIVYTEPGRGRQLLTEVPANAVAARALEERQQKAEAQLEENQHQISDLMQRNQQLEISNAALNQQMAEVKPAWRSYVENFQDKFRIGTLFYADYRYYTHTGWQPQELTQLTNLGPGNDGWNSFDITRTYLNIFFFPTPDWTLRLTPNMYKTIGSSNDKEGAVTGFGSNLDGDLGVRMKYAYLQYNSLWKNVPDLKGGTITLGEIPNPFVAWEEDLYGYRFVNLTPWNYYSLSSTQLGISMQGPIKFGGEKTYFDYAFGVYNNASFHAFETTDTKQGMIRGTVYPFGSTWRFQGLGITGFYDYGYGSATPDQDSLPAKLKGPQAHITRVAALLHYTAENWGLAGEFEYGYNAFSASNLFSGAGPADEFGVATTSYAAFTAMSNAILNNGQARQLGFSFFGHYHIPRTPLTLFGLFSLWQPNTNVNVNPLDFERWVAGVSYQYNEYLRFAVDSQNLSYYHGQFAFPVTEATNLGWTPPTGFKGTSIPSSVPWDTHSIFANVEFSY
jgi:hypothetical protein